MRLGWLSDIHLNFVRFPSIRAYMSMLATCEVDAWLLGGDIGEADSVELYLAMLDRALPRPIYFVLGNHRFYGGSIADTCARVRELVAQSEHLVWLTDAERRLADGLAIVGDDGSRDARFGNALTTPVDLNDFGLVAELGGGREGGRRRGSVRT